MRIKDKIGLIGGSSLIDAAPLLKPKTMPTPYGRAVYYLIKTCPLILRHGLQNKVPPHRINHQANIFCFKKLNKKFIFSFNSVGSLKKEIKPGEFLLPDDYIGFAPLTFYDEECKFVAPELSLTARGILMKILKKLKFNFGNKGIYFETKGPRLETKAEIALISNFADVVGMTMAKEAALAQEMNLEYASLCSIDNYAHGITKTPLSQETIKRNQLKTRVKIKKIFEEILKI